MTSKLYFSIFLILVFAKFVDAQKTDSSLFDYTKLHEIHIDFEDEDFWDQLIYNYDQVLGFEKSVAQIQKKDLKTFYTQMLNLKSAKSESAITYIPATVKIDGDIIDSVGVRLKGFSSYFSTSGNKKSIKLDFNEFNDTLNYLGLRKINLNNGIGDPSFQRDFISYYMMREAGVAAPRVSFAKLYLNEMYWGLYTIVEQVDKTFVENNFISGKGDLYKAISRSELEYLTDNFSDYNETIELKTNEKKSDGSAYVNLVKSIDQLDGSAFTDSIQKLFYMDYFFKVLAIDIISKNWDSYMDHGRNFYLYHEPVSELFYWIPWDYNLSWDGAFHWDFEPDPEEEPYSSFKYDTSMNKLALYLELEKEGLEFLYIDINILGQYNFGQFNASDLLLQITDTTVIFIDTVQNYEEGIYPYRINAYYEEGKLIDKNGKMVLTDSSNIECITAYDMSRPYILSNEIYEEIYKRDSLCCDCQWDAICENLYNSYPDTIAIDFMYSIDYYRDKVLINKLFSKAEFKNRYFDAFKYILDSVYHADKLVSLIQQNTDLIRNAVYSDTNKVFSINEFENDVEVMCDQNYVVTSLTRLIENRKKGLDKEFESLNYTAQSIKKTIAYNDVVINEFLAARSENDTIQKEDWIELYNNTDDIIVLDELGLSDDKNDVMKFVFSKNTVIKPDGFLVVWADDKNKKNGLHANFKLSKDGEDVVLYSEKYNTIDDLSFGPQYEDSAYARFPNGTGEFKFMYPTRNRHNVEKVAVVEKIITKASGEIVVFPNPASDKLFIKPNQNGLYRIEIYNSMGAMVFETSSFEIYTEINISTYSNGIYVLKIHQNGRAYTGKVIIMN